MSALWGDRLAAQQRAQKRRAKDRKAALSRRRVRTVRHPVKAARKRWLW